MSVSIGIKIKSQTEAPYLQGVFIRMNMVDCSLFVFTQVCALRFSRKRAMRKLVLMWKKKEEN